MASFAEIDDSNIVIRVLVIADKDTQDTDGNEVESIGAKYLSDGFGGTWKKTSPETQMNIHILGGTPFRKNFAGTGFTYNESKDAFYAPRPFDSWTLNDDTCIWDAPVTYPDDGKYHTWNEDTQAWDLINRE